MSTEADRILAMAADQRVYLVFAMKDPDHGGPNGGADDYRGCVRCSTDEQAVNMARAMCRDTMAAQWFHVARLTEEGHLEVVDEQRVEDG